jgi:hypothetical protein
VGVSIREQGILAVVDLLGGTGSPALNVFRSRLDQVGPEDLPCFDVTPGDEEVSDPGEFGDHESVTRKVSFFVRAIIDAANQGDAYGVPDAVIDDSGLDPFYVYAVKTLCGGEADLGGVVIDVEEHGNKTVFQPMGRDLIGLEMSFSMTFATKRGDPTQKG